MTNFSYSWKALWSEVLTIVSREERAEAVSCEQLVLNLITTLVDFLHCTRQYIVYDLATSSGLGDIVDEALLKLQDTRLPICIEGVLLLVTCLPTDYAHYDAALPQWVSKWASINHNAYWDCCWLTLFTRARKYSSAYDWTALSPFLLTKSKELMQLPTVENGGSGHNHTEFPHTFPGYYTKLLTIQTDQRKVAINKIAKLLYFLTIQPESQVIPELITVTPPIDTTAEADNRTVLLSGFNSIPPLVKVNKNAAEMVLFFQSIRTYFYPGNSGNYTPQLAYFLGTFVFQLCRHVGRGVAAALLESDEPTNASRGEVWHKFTQPMHIGTVQYLIGSVLSLLLEGLYNKNQMMAQFCSSCLKNLVSVDATIGDIFVPFLLTALDPAAVNQSHQAPVAMQTISLCFKALLFPSPVILKYLPDILRLSLPGIDASDANKTTITLNLYSNVLAWIPITSAYTVPKEDAAATPPSYFSLVRSSDGTPFVDGTRISRDEYQSEWDALSTYMTSEWAPALLDKLFTLLDAQEQKVKGTRESPITSCIGQCAGYFFQAVAPTEGGVESALRKSLEAKVLDNFVKTTPLNASKACAKLMESLTTTNPAALPAILAAVLSADIVSGECSSDKLAYRLYLAAGAVRSAFASNILASMSILEPILTGAKFVHHAEKPVRKATGKLIRDTLKGCTSFYPAHIQPHNMFGKQAALLGAPNVVSADSELTWHVPTVETLPGSAVVLRMTLTKSIDEISAAMTEISSSSDSDSTGSSGAGQLKKVEDLVSNCLHVVERALRGAAEVLGDEGMNVGQPESQKPLLSTGRGSVLSALAASHPAEAKYLLTVRSVVLAFLVSLHSSFEALSSDSIFSSLKNHAVIAPQCLKIYSLLVTRRMSCLKDVENIRKWVKYTKRNSRTSISKILYKLLKDREEKHVAAPPRSASSSLSAQWHHALTSRAYWQYHDLSTNSITCAVWLQHGVRLQELSHQTIRSSVPVDNVAENASNNLYVSGLKQLIAQCEHEYDGIRAAANKTFEKVASRFGYRLTDFIRQFIANLTKADTSYLRASASLSVLKQTRVIKRIMSDWELTELFLGAVSSSSVVISAVEQMDQREKLMHLLTEVFVKYLGGWSHVHLTAGQSTAAVIKSALSHVGYHQEVSAEDMQGLSEDGTPAVATAAAAGLRFETFAAYIMLHFIGHRDVEITANIWQWALDSLCTSHGQPAQSIALSALARLAQIANVHKSTFIGSADAASLRATLSPANNSKAQSLWKSVLHGVATCHPKHSEDGTSAQWSQGIDHILRSSEFLKIALNRNITCVLSDKNLYSHHFSREDAGIFYSLALSGLLDGSDTIFSVEALTALLECSKTLPSTSEAEVRSNNATRSELFAGLLRAFHVATAAGQQVTNSEEVQRVFLAYLVESLEKLSVDYAKDWTEAVYFAFNGTVAKATDAIPSYVVEAFRQLLRSQSTAATSETSASEEGFALQGKVLLLTKALLQADLGVTRLGAASEVASAVAAAVNDPASNVVSPYRTSRLEIASVLSILTELSPVNPDLSQVRTKLLSVCASFSNASDSSNDNSPVPMDVSEGSAEESVASGSNKGANVALKNASETAFIWLQFLMQRVPLWKNHLEIVDLLSIAVLGTSSGDIELVKLGHDTAIFSCKAIISAPDTVSSNPVGAAEEQKLMQRILVAFESHATHLSWRVRETTLKCLSVLMANNWPSFTAEQRKLTKDMYARGINDVKPEVQHLAKAGMVAYLAFKSSSELKTIAEAYIKNSDALAVREKKKRKLQKDSSTSAAADKPDAVYSTTVYMMCCLLMSSPYDMPPYLPALVTSLVRHVTHTAFKDTVAKAVQMFKMSHQDRWEEFKLKFSREQLEDLQGAGAASYFT